MGAEPGADVVDLVCAHQAGDIMARGERSWLDDHGIERGSFPTSVGGHGFNGFGVTHPVCRRGAVRTRLRVLVRRGSAGSIARDSGHGGNAGARDGPSARMR